MVGAVVSRTVIVNWADAALLRVSLAVQVTVCASPRANSLPEAGKHVTGRTPSTRSVAVGSVQVAVAPAALVASSVWFVGTFEKVGLERSVTVTENDFELGFWRESVAEHSTFTTPMPKVLPVAGEQDTGRTP